MPHTATAAGLLPGARSGGPHQAGSGATTVTLYVSPRGSDANPGTLALPLASLDAARMRVRQLPRGGGRISVILRGGRYILQQAVQFTQADSGTPGNPVTYAAYPGETPILSGGALVTNWQLVDPQRNIWRALLPLVAAGQGGPRTLYVGGVRYTRPRYPQLITGAPLVTGASGAPGMITSVDWSATTNPSDMEIVNQGSFSEYRIPITGIGSGGIGGIGGKTLLTPLVATQIFRTEVSIAARSTIENVFEFLSVGQFYVNRVAGTISCIPLPGVSLPGSTCVLARPSIQTLISVTGAPGAPVHDITFSGIQFSETGFQMDPSWGYSRQQAGVMSVPAAELVNYFLLPPSALDLLYVARVQVLGCVFTRLGQCGLKVGLGSVDVAVVGNLFFDISGAGLYLGLPVAHQSEADRPARLMVANNVLHHAGVEFTDCPALQQFWSTDTVLAYNSIADTPWSGLCTGWGWGQAVYRNPYQSGLLVHHNRVQRAMQLRQDGAGIYSNGTSPREQITDNAVSDIPTGFGLYLDEGSTGKIVSRNAVYGVTSANINLYAPYGVNFLSGNVMDAATISITTTSGTPGGTVQVTTPQTIVPSADPAMQAIVAASGVQPAYRALLGKGAAI